MTAPTFQRIGVLGLGRWGATLASALARKRLGLTAVRPFRNRPPSSLPRALQPFCAPRLEDFLARVDLLFLAVRDDDLPRILPRLQSGPMTWRGRAVIHSSGARNRSVLAPLAEAGAATGVFHPLNSFTDLESGLNALPGTWFGINAPDPRLRSQLETLARALEGRPIHLNDEIQPAYHLAAVLVANAPVVFAEWGRRVLRRFDPEGRIPWEAYGPLARTAAVSMAKSHPLAHLTGPWVRNDRDTVQLHETVLREMPAPQRELYRMLYEFTRELLKPTETNGPPPDPEPGDPP